jgi:hypothetical protein
MKPSRLFAFALSCGASLAGTSLHAQACGDSSRAGRFVVIGSIADDQRKRDELAGCERATLVRSPSALSADLQSTGWRPSVEVVLPQTSLTWNSALPNSMNDGGQWAGRGTSASAMTGVRFRWWRIAGTIAPEIFGTSNALFSFRPGTFPGRSPYGSWSNGNLPSIDQPTRFGYRSFVGVTPGQSSLEVRAKTIGVGVSTENLWWGPGLRTAIVMSNNAAGIPQAYVRSIAPLRSPIGSFEGRILLGFLTESPYFDSEPRNDHRSMSAGVITLTPVIDSNLTIGATRASYGSLRHLGGLGRHTFDFVKTLPSSHRDEIQSVFARWGFPSSGFAVHGEWSRLRIPSVREMLITPERTQGYTVGLQWSEGIAGGRFRLRMQGEATMLEQPRLPFNGRSLGYYASSRVAQGYTQYGQVIGAATGPGSSSQWLAADLASRGWTMGLELERIRWDDDAYYAEAPTGFLYVTHDVSLSERITLTRVFDRLGVRSSLRHSHRMNYQNQSGNGGVFFNSVFDVTNYTFTLSAAYRR